MEKTPAAIVNEWTEIAANILGISAQLSEDGLCTLLINNDLLVTIEVPEEGSWFYLYSPLKQLPKDSPEEAFFLCQMALELSASQDITQGGAIGLVPGEPQLIYSRLLPIEGCDEYIFAQVLTLFYETAFDLRSRLDLSL